MALCIHLTPLSRSLFQNNLPEDMLLPREIFFPSCDLTVILVLFKGFIEHISANIRMPRVCVNLLVVMVGRWLLCDKPFPYWSLGFKMGRQWFHTESVRWRH